MSAPLQLKTDHGSNGSSFHTSLLNGKCTPMSAALQLKTDHGPNGEVERTVSPDGGNAVKLSVTIEEDPEHPGTQRLRWSNGELWYPGEVVEKASAKPWVCMEQDPECPGLERLR